MGEEQRWYGSIRVIRTSSFHIWYAAQMPSRQASMDAAASPNTSVSRRYNTQSDLELEWWEIAKALLRTRTFLKILCPQVSNGSHDRFYWIPPYALGAQFVNGAGVS